MAKKKKTGKGIFRLPENAQRVFLVDPPKPAEKKTAEKKPE